MSILPKKPAGACFFNIQDQAFDNIVRPNVITPETPRCHLFQVQFLFQPVQH